MPFCKNKNTIGSGQFFCLLYVSHVLHIVMTTPGHQTAQGMEQLLWSVPLSAVGTVLLSLPFWWMYHRYPGLGIGELSRALLGKGVAVVVLAGYGGLFLYHGAVSLVQYQIFVMDTMLPQVSVILLTTAVLATACYGAWMGIEALARAAGFFFVTILLSLLVIFYALFPKVSWEHFSPLRLQEGRRIVETAGATLSWMVEIGTMAVIFPYVRGKVGRNLIFWSVGEGLTLALTAFLTVGVLGEYVSTQLFPFYAVASMAEIGSLRRQDALFVGIWTTGLYARTALLLVALSLCVRSLGGEKAGRWALLAGGGLLWVGSLLLLRFPQVIQILSQRHIVGLAAVLLFLLVPLALLLFSLIKKPNLSPRKEESAPCENGESY